MANMRSCGALQDIRIESIPIDGCIDMKRLRNFFKSKTASISDNESFVTLVRVAKEDPMIRAQLVSILTLDDFNRRSALNTMVEQMRFKKAPQSFVSAVAMLIDDKVARKVLAMIGDT